MRRALICLTKTLTAIFAHGRCVIGAKGPTKPQPVLEEHLILTELTELMRTRAFCYPKESGASFTVAHHGNPPVCQIK